MTNFEKIKNMSVEELAHTMNIVISNCYKCPIRNLCYMDDSHFTDCTGVWKKWFENEVEE